MDISRTLVFFSLLIGSVLFSLSKAQTANGPAAEPYQEFSRWLCVGEKSVGFYFNTSTKTWEYAKFKADRKYLVAPIPSNYSGDNANQVVRYSLTIVGESFSPFECGGFEDDMLYCENKGFLFPYLETFTFNASTLRFVHTYTGSWLKESPEGGGDTPLIELGRCSPF